MRPQATKLLADKSTAPGLRRQMVKTAVIMGLLVRDERSCAYPRLGLRLIGCLATLRFSLSEGHHPLAALPIGDRSVQPE